MQGARGAVYAVEEAAGNTRAELSELEALSVAEACGWGGVEVNSKDPTNNPDCGGSLRAR